MQFLLFCLEPYDILHGLMHILWNMTTTFYKSIKKVCILTIILIHFVYLLVIGILQA